MVNLLLCHGTDALSRVYCYWLGKQLDSTYQLLKVSPFEPAFSALLLENSSEIASNPRIACKIFRKKYFYLSTPIISSMKAVAKKIDLITYMKYAVNESTKYNDIFPTVELICMSTKPIQVKDKSQLFLKLFMIVLQSESYYMLKCLVHLSKYLGKLDNLANAFRTIYEKFHNGRIISRLLLSISYHDDFVQLVQKKDFLNYFSLLYTKFYQSPDVNNL